MSTWKIRFESLDRTLIGEFEYNDHLSAAYAHMKFIQNIDPGRENAAIALCDDKGSIYNYNFIDMDTAIAIVHSKASDQPVSTNPEDYII
jgi:hypothetical protein